MPKNGLNVSLNSYDDIFSTEETRQEEQREQVQQIPIFTFMYSVGVMPYSLEKHLEK